MTAELFNQWVDQYADAVYRFILKNLRHEEDSRDIVQGAFEKLWNNRTQVSPETVKSYLFTIAYNLMIDHIRKNKRISYAEQIHSEAVVAPTKGKELQQLLHEALELLSPRSRSLILLKDYEGYSYEEIGQITGLTTGQVRVNLHRARLKLRDHLVSVEKHLE